MNLNEFKYLTINCEEDWFYNTGCQHPLVCPKGTKVEFIKVYTNRFGIWFQVKYKNEIKYIYPHLCDGNVMINSETFTRFDVSSFSTKSITIYFDRFGNKYKLLNDKGELELL